VLTGAITQDSIYTFWSFIHVVAKMLLMTYNATKVHDCAYEMKTFLLSCPIQYYSPEVNAFVYLIYMVALKLTLHHLISPWEVWYIMWAYKPKVQH